ncbi:MAG: hypothetical protein WBH98_01115 [Bacteroidales bacterium]
MKSKIIKTIVQYILLFLGLTTLFLLINILSSSMPSDNIKRNLSKNLDFYISLKDYGKPFADDHAQVFDYNSEALILNIACSVDNTKPFQSALLGSYYSEHNDEPKFSYIKKSISGEGKIYENINYPRYWHGASFIYRFFLNFFDYASLRLFLFFVTSVLVFTTVILQYKRTNFQFALATMLGLILVNFVFMQYLIQYSSALIIALIASIIILSMKKPNNKQLGIFFFITGAVTVYIDLLTAPVITLGLPLLIYISIQQFENKFSLKKQLREIVLFSFLWAVAYASIWIVKWVLVDIFTDFNIITSVTNQVKYRSGFDRGANLFGGIVKNINNINLVLFLITICVFLLINVRPNCTKNIKKLIPYLLVCTYPFLWIFALNEHSYSHDWFVYRTLLITITGLLMAIATLRLKKVKNKH